MPVGFMAAAVAFPPSPENPVAPFPAKTVRLPEGSSTNTCERAAMNTLSPATQTPVGWKPTENAGYVPTGPPPATVVISCVCDVRTPTAKAHTRKAQSSGFFRKTTSFGATQRVAFERVTNCGRYSHETGRTERESGRAE